MHAPASPPRPPRAAPRPAQTGGLVAGIVAILTLGCAGAPVVERSEAAAARRESISPRFAWPEHLSLEVSRQALRAERVAGKVERSEGPVERWRWTFRRQGGERLLRIVPVEAGEAEPWSLGLDAGARIARVDGLAARDRQPLLQLWAELVGLWKDRDLELGQAYRREAPDGAPELQLIARRVAPCPEEPAPARCAHLESLIEMEERRFKDQGEEVIAAFLESLRETLPELSELPVRVVSVRPERQTELLTGADTLIPRSFTERTYLRVELEVGEAGGEVESIVSEVVEETRWTFRRLNPGSG